MSAPTQTEHENQSFAETALRLGGKSEEEAAAPGPWTRPTSRSRRCSPRSTRPSTAPSTGPSGTARSRSTCSSRRRCRRRRPAMPAMEQSLRGACADAASRARILDDKGKVSPRRSRRAGAGRLLGHARSIRSTAARARRSPASRRFLTRMATIDPTIGRPGLGSRLHRRRRSRAHASAPPSRKQRFLPRLASGERALRLRPDRAGRRLRPDRPADHGRARRRRLRRQRREAVHHQRHPRPDHRPGLPDRRQAGRADRRPARAGERALPDRAATACYALRHAAQQRPALPRASACRRKTC